jgi:hemoglobin-like flavoprotein
MSLDKELLRKSFALFVACEPGLTHHFYRVLFCRYPEAKKLFFRKPMAEQERLLTSTIAALVQHIDDRAYLEMVLCPLGVKHIEYGATRESYPWLREVLIDTFRHVAGAVWTDELASQWRQAYDLFAAIMIDAAERHAKGGA